MHYEIQRSQLPSVRFTPEADQYAVVFPNGKAMFLTQMEWMAFRVIQNSLVHTEPVTVE